MHYLNYHEQIQHRTGDVPLAYYPVDEDYPRYRMPMHWHKESEIIRILSGRMHFYLDDDELIAEAGDLLTIGSGVIHGGEPEKCVYECIVYDPQALIGPIDSCRAALTPLLRNNIFLKNSKIESDPAFKAVVEHLFATAARLQGQELNLLSAVFGFLHCQQANMNAAQLRTVSERTWQKAEQLKPALEYIEHNYSQRISLDTLARLTGFSPKYFCRYFRAIVHRSPIDYLNYYRVECAAHFLASADMNVAEVAAQCGFSDSSAFIKQFRKYKGTTPRQYRTRVQENSKG